MSAEGQIFYIFELSKVTELLGWVGLDRQEIVSVVENNLRLATNRRSCGSCHDGLATGIAQTTCPSK